MLRHIQEEDYEDESSVASDESSIVEDPSSYSHRNQSMYSTSSSRPSSGRHRPTSARFTSRPGSAMSNCPTSSRPTSRSTKKKKEEPIQKIYEIDYVGTGTFRVSQLNLLSKRSIETSRNVDCLLSARGLHHRNRDVFVRDVHNSTNIIAGLMRGEKVTSAKYKPSPQLFQPHFNRAIGFERLLEIDKAIEDYTLCLRVNPNSAVVFFNRANLYRLKKQYALSISDMNEAVRIEPANIDFRNNRALLYRECGHYPEAIKDTLLSRALQLDPTVARNLELGGQVSLDNDAIYAFKIQEDPILAALAILPTDRTKRSIEPIVDFLRTLKFFQGFVTSGSLEVLEQVAMKIELISTAKETFVFEEGELGHHFFIVLDGEVSIVKVKRRVLDEIVDMQTIVRLYRGHTFGETALESKGGKRTAGALATQKTQLLSIHIDEYQYILGRYKSELKEEVRNVLISSALFEEWPPEKLDYLASFAIVKQYGANSEIIKANEPVTTLMMIKSGIVQLLKKIPKPTVTSILRKSGNAIIFNEDFHEEPGLWVLNKHWNHNLDEHTKGQQQQLPPIGGNNSSLPPSPGPYHKSNSNSKLHRNNSLNSHTSGHTSGGGGPGAQGGPGTGASPANSPGPHNNNNNLMSSSASVGSTGSGSLYSAHEKADFTVGVLGSGQVFGELAILDATRPSSVTAVSSTAVEIYCFDKDVLLGVGVRFQMSTMKQLHESLTLHDPPMDKLGYYFRSKYNWEVRKNRLMYQLKKEAGK